MASDRIGELKAVLDRVAAQAELDKDYDPDEHEGLRAEAVSAFVAGGVRLLEEGTPALWRYYRTTVAEFTPEQRREYGLPEIPSRRTSGSTSAFRMRNPPGISAMSHSGGARISHSRERSPGNQSMVSSWSSKTDSASARSAPYDGHLK